MSSAAPSTILHYLFPEQIGHLDQEITAQFGQGLLGTPTTGSAHVIMAVLVTVFTLFIALRYRSRRASAADSALPEESFNARSFVELLCESILGMMEGVMGREAARYFLPLIGTMAFFILFANLSGLIPGLTPATDVISTNAVMALIVFLATHVYGVKKNGFEHFKHMMGPLLVLAPLIFLIELIGHLARPLSLTLRLFGNMVGDHKVLSIFLGFGLFFVPLPVMVLGMIVCIVQTLVFCLLSVVYIGMAIEDLHHEEH
jgi:F-type H+-transporting ATPase subunit a